MRNTFFPTFSSFCNTGENEVHMPMAPNLSVDLHRLHGIGSGFYADSHACNDLHLGSFTPLSSTQEYSTHTIDMMPEEDGNVYKTSSMYKDHQTNLLLSPDQNATRSTRKRANATEITFTAASKKKKGFNAEDSHQHSQQSATSSVAPMKAPMRRSHKLGDRITALQQLVSPFGKTDTASVLQEATVYIKLLQEQIQVLSNPYFRFKASLRPQGILGEDKLDLKSKGLCLVPVSTTANLPADAGNSNSCTSTAPNTHVCL